MFKQLVAFLKIQIFGLPSEDEISFESFSKISIHLFRLTLFDFKPLDEGVGFKQKLLYTAKQSYMIICLGAMILETTLRLYANHTMEGSDTLLAFLNSALYGFLSIYNLVPILTPFLRKKDICKLFQDIEECFNRRMKRNKVCEVKRYLVDYQYYVKLVVTIIFLTASTMAAIPTVLFLTSGDLKIFVKYLYGNDFHVNNIIRSEFVPFIIVYKFWSQWNLVTFFLAADVLLYAFVTVIVIEFNFLAIDIKNFYCNPKRERATRIHNLIDHHNRLLDISDKLQEIYNAFFFITFVASSMILCILAFRFAISDHGLSVYSLLLPFFGPAAVQLYIVCYFGQKIIDSSEYVAVEAYNCEWEADDENSIKKKFFFIILRAQKTKRLTAMKFVNVSLETFITVRRFQSS